MSSTVEKLDHRSHILKLPDTYIGSVEKSSEETWIYMENGDKIQKKMVNFIFQFQIWILSAIFLFHP